MIVRMREEQLGQKFSDIAANSEEKKESPLERPVLMSQEMLDLLARIDLVSRSRLPTHISDIITSNSLVKDAIISLNEIFAVSNDIIIILVRHQKYIIKIIDALLLLKQNDIFLTEKSIKDIVDAGYYVNYVVDALIAFNSQLKLNYQLGCGLKINDIENIIEGVAKAEVLAKNMSRILLALCAFNVPMTKKNIDKFSTVDDAGIFSDALMVLKLNEVKLTIHIITSIANAEYFALEVAHELVRVKEEGIPLEKNYIDMIVKAKGNARIMADSLILSVKNTEVIRPSFVSPLKLNTVEYKRSLSPSSR